MAVNLPAGFKITSEDPIDVRVVLSTDDMLDPHIGFLLPKTYFAVNTTNSSFYIYDINNEFIDKASIVDADGNITDDSALGKYRKVGGSSCKHTFEARETIGDTVIGTLMIKD